MATAAAGQGAGLVCLLLAIMPGIHCRGFVTGETDNLNNRILGKTVIKSHGYGSRLSSYSREISSIYTHSKSQVYVHDSSPGATGSVRTRPHGESVNVKDMLNVDIKIRPIRENSFSVGSNSGRDERRNKEGGALIFTFGCEGGDCREIQPTLSSPEAAAAAVSLRTSTARPQETIIKELDNFSSHRPGEPIVTNWREIDAGPGGRVRYESPPGDVRPYTTAGDKQGASPDRDIPNTPGQKPSFAVSPLSKPTDTQENTNYINNKNIITPIQPETNADSFTPSADLKLRYNLPEIGDESAASHEDDVYSKAGFIVKTVPTTPTRQKIIHPGSDISPVFSPSVLDTEVNRNYKQNVIIGIIPSKDISLVSVTGLSPPNIHEKPGTEYKVDARHGGEVLLDLQTVSRTRHSRGQTSRNQMTKADTKSPRLPLAKIGYRKVNSVSIEKPSAPKRFTHQDKFDYLRKPNSDSKIATSMRTKREAGDYTQPGNAEKSMVENLLANDTEADDLGQGQLQQLHNHSSPGISLRSEGLVGLVDPSREKSRYREGIHGGDLGLHGQQKPEPELQTVTEMEPSAANMSANTTAGEVLTYEDVAHYGSGGEGEAVPESESPGNTEAGPPKSLPEFPPHNGTNIDDLWPEPEPGDNATVDVRWREGENITLRDNHTDAGGADGRGDDGVAGTGGMSESHRDTRPAESFPESEPESEPHPTEGWECSGPSCYVEPTPDWDSAKQEWKAAWEIHIYGAGILFAILAVYALISIIGLVRKRDLMSQGYFISLNIMLLILCTTRAIYLLVDAYNSGGTFHPIIAYFLYSITFPCLTSAFSILFLSLLQTLKMRLLSPKIQKPGVLVAIIGFHFLLSLATDIVIGMIADTRIMLVVCESFFVLWGVFLFCAYIYIFRKLYLAACRRHKEMLRLAISQTKLAGSEEQAAKKAPRPVFNAAVKITLVTATLGLISAGLEVYVIITLFRSVHEGVPDPWPWWSLHLGSRVAEVGMCVTMSYVATQPFRYNRLNSSGKEETSCLDVIYFVPCHRYCTDSVKDQYVSAPTECSYSQPITYNPAYGYVNEYIYNTANAANGGHVPVEDDPAITSTLNGSLKSKSLDSKGDRKRKSMLVKEEGFVRFRHDGDPEGEFIVSTDDELASNDGVLSNGSVSGIRTNGYPPGQTLTYYIAGGGGDGCGRSKSSPRRYHSVSVPNTGENTPATPRSFCSTDLELDMAGSVFSFRPPSSIHLRESIEGALNYYPRFTLKTPDYLDMPDNLSRPRTPDDLAAEDYHSAKSGPPDTPAQARHSDLHSPRFSNRAMGDVKTTWFHKSPKNYWRAISQARARNSNLSLASRCSSRYSPLDDGGRDGSALNTRHKASGLRRSNSDSLADPSKSEDCVNI